MSTGRSDAALLMFLDDGHIAARRQDEAANRYIEVFRIDSLILRSQEEQLDTLSTAPNISFDASRP